MTWRAACCGLAVLAAGAVGLQACASPGTTPGSSAAAAPAPSPASAGGIDVVELTAERVQSDLAQGKYTTLQLTQAFLERIDRYEDHYNAFISLNPEALAVAAALDQEIRSTGPRGPLHGVPVVIKDNIDYGGLVTTAGFSGFSGSTGGVDMIPDDDAAVVERLRAAGAVILGKTNLPDFAGHGTRTNSSVAGVTLNPYNEDKAPGGSSGGTATAVNASFAVLGLGTETGGSIQNPAAAQALVGVKPTFGLVPLEGVVPMSATYVDVVGPLAKSVWDAAITLEVIAGPSDDDPRTFSAADHVPEEGYVARLSETALEGRRFGLVGEGWRTSYLPLAPQTEALYRKAVALLVAQGADVVEDPFRGTRFIELYSQRRGFRSQGAMDLLSYLQGLGEGASFNSIEEWEELTGQTFRRGRRQQAPWRTDPTEDRDSLEDRGTFQDWRDEIQALFRAVLEEHRLDGLFFPQAGAPIPDLIEDPERPDYNPNNHPELPSNIVNDIGLPVVTLPFAYYSDGTPFVLAFIGDTWTEAELLSYAYDLEQATSARVPPELRSGSGG
ncbi:amidase [Gemmatimonadota bacterium]